MGDPTERRLELTPLAQRVAAASAYGLLAAALVSTRVIGLDSSLWHDEVVAVVEFIRAGPGEILAGPDLSHELFGILAWATTSAVGESEIALRLWSVLPFLLGVAVVTALAPRATRRTDWDPVPLPCHGVTAAPRHLAASPRVRARVPRDGRHCSSPHSRRHARRAGGIIVAFCVAGIVGTCTLPQFGIAFVGDERCRCSPTRGSGAAPQLGVGSLAPRDRGLVRAAHRRGPGRLAHRGRRADRHARAPRRAVPSRAHTRPSLDRRHGRRGEHRVAPARAPRSQWSWRRAHFSVTADRPRSSAPASSRRSSCCGSRRRT